MVNHSNSQGLSLIKHNLVVVPGGRWPVGVRFKMVGWGEFDFTLRVKKETLAILATLHAEATECGALDGQIGYWFQSEMHINHKGILLFLNVD